MMRVQVLLPFHRAASVTVEDIYHESTRMEVNQEVNQIPGGGCHHGISIIPSWN